MRIPLDQRTERERDILTDHFARNYHFAVGQKRYKELKFDELDKKLRELKQTYPQISQAMTVAEAPDAKQILLESSRRLPYQRHRSKSQHAVRAACARDEELGADAARSRELARV